MLLLLLGGCKSRKAGVTTTSTVKQEQSAEMFRNQDYKTLKAKASVSMPMLSAMSVKASLSLEVGKGFVISLQPLLGLEMYRIICSTDSIIFIDRLSHTYMADPYKNFTNKDYNLNYGMLEGLFCNRFFDPLEENFKDMSVISNGSGSICRKQAKNYYVEFTTESGSIYRTNVSKNDRSEYVMADYSAFQQYGKYTFPTQAVCNVQSQKFPLSLNISFSSLEFNTDVFVSESVPSGYKKVSIESLTKSLFK